MAIPQPLARPPAAPIQAAAGQDSPSPASLHTILAEQLAITHRVAMSGMASVAAWSDTLRTAELSVAGIVKHTEMISRLGQSLTRMMAESRRAATTLERLQRAGAEAERRGS